MLHFLLGLALCIFIGERVWHYAAIIRLRREERREIRRIEALYNPSPGRGFIASIAVPVVVTVIALVVGAAILPGLML